MRLWYGIFFFSSRRRHTRFDCDWSSDVCSSDLSDDEIRDGIKLLAQTTGIFTETAGGVTTAVLAKLAQRGDIDPSERVVAVITGERSEERRVGKEGRSRWSPYH